MGNERNYYIDFLKFVFSVIVVVYHSWLFTGIYGNGYFNAGNIVVEFYFIVTGYLFIKSVEKRKNEKNENIGLMNIKYIASKLKNIIPSLIIVFIIGYFITYKDYLTDFKILFSDSTISEFFLSGFLGYGININVGSWYISVMALVLFILYPIAVKYKKMYNYYIAPLIVIFILGLCNFYKIDLLTPHGKNYIMINGVYRGLIFINLGVICYEISNYIKNLKISKLKRILITLFETITYILLILNMHYNFFGYIFVSILFLINVAITFSNQSYSIKLFKSSIFERLGRFGFMMYISNIPVRTFIMNEYRSLPYNKMLLIYMVYVVILSAFCYILTEVILKKRKI